MGGSYKLVSSKWRSGALSQIYHIPIINHVPTTVTQAATANEVVTMQTLRRDPGLAQQASSKQQTLQARIAEDLSQGRVHGANANSNNFHNVHSHINSNNFHNVHSQCNVQSSSTNIDSG